MNAIEKKQKLKNHFLLTIIVAFASISVLLFLPSLPFIAHHFHMRSHECHFTMSCYLIGYGLGQLLCGPLSNRFGRKSMVCFGALIALISGILCLFATYTRDFLLFACGRCLLAVGSCGGVHCAFTMIADDSPSHTPVHSFSTLLLLFGMSAVAAVFLGGIITEYLGWQYNLYFLIAFTGITLLYVFYALPETLYQQKTNPKVLQFKKILNAYIHECKNTKLLLVAAITGCGMIMLYLPAFAAPFIGINLIGLSPHQYGAWACIPIFGLIAGSLFIQRASFFMSPVQLLKLGCKILITAAVLSFGAFYYGHTNPWSLFFPMFCINTGLSLVFPSAAALTLTYVHNKAIGISLMLFIHLSLCAISVVFIGIRSIIKNPCLLPLLFSLLIFLIFLLTHLLYRQEELERLKS